jgi:hypothetical protein
MSITWFAFELSHSAECFRNLVIAHGIARAPLAKIRPAGDGTSIHQRDLNDGRHLIVARSFSEPLPVKEKIGE